MKIIISEKIPRIIKNRKRLEEKLEVKISIRGREVTIEGLPLNEYVAEKVIEAIDFGFSLSNAFLIKEEILKELEPD
jgi:rRNA processing protein Krr1/Pno1